MSAIINGLKAGLVVGLIAGLIGGALQVVGSIPILGMCICLVTPVTWLFMWFLFPFAAGILAAMFAKSELRSFVDGAIGGLVGGIVYAILSWVIGFVVGIVLLIFWQVISILLQAGGKLNIGNIIVSVISAFFMNIVGTLIGLGIVFVAGIFWGIVGGALYAMFVAKPK